MAYNDENSGPYGVGGWMYLFLFGFAVVSPFRMIFGTATSLYADPSIAAAIGERWTIYQVAVWIMVATGLAGIGYVVWRLFNEFNPKTVQITIWAIPALGFGLPLADSLLAIVILNVSADLIFGEIAIDLVRTSVYCAIWCTYFKVSKRVRNTYSSQIEGDTVQVFQ